MATQTVPMETTNDYELAYKLNVMPITDDIDAQINAFQKRYYDVVEMILQYFVVEYHKIMINLKSCCDEKTYYYKFLKDMENSIKYYSRNTGEGLLKIPKFGKTEFRFTSGKLTELKTKFFELNIGLDFPSLEIFNRERDRIGELLIRPFLGEKQHLFGRYGIHVNMNKCEYTNASCTVFGKDYSKLDCLKDDLLLVTTKNRDNYDYVWEGKRDIYRRAYKKVKGIDICGPENEEQLIKVAEIMKEKHKISWEDTMDNVSEYIKNIIEGNTLENKIMKFQQPFHDVHY